MDQKTVPYALARAVDLPYEEADRRIREELQKEGFGILTEIDVQATPSGPDRRAPCGPVPPLQRRRTPDRG
jgi:hypothetical protein